MKSQKGDWLKFIIAISIFCYLYSLGMESSQAKEENANFNFGLNYFKADQYEDAWRHFSIAAKEGCKESQTYLGIICWMVYNDPDTAKIYFEEARKHKEINAIYQLARLYENEGKIAEAISYYNEAIKGGHANAENKLGMLYFNRPLLKLN